MRMPPDPAHRTKSNLRATTAPGHGTHVSTFEPTNDSGRRYSPGMRGEPAPPQDFGLVTC